MMIQIFRSVGVLVVAGTLIFGAGGAFAQGSDAARQACTPDAMRLCGDAIPDVGKVTACMKAKYSQLSEPCRVAMRGGGEKRAVTRRSYHHYKHHCRHCG
jgi:hypothetical protein